MPMYGLHAYTALFLLYGKRVSLHIAAWIFIYDCRMRTVLYSQCLGQLGEGVVCFPSLHAAEGLRDL